MAGKRESKEIADLGFRNLLSKKKKKISSQTKKEMENFIPASLKRHFFRKLNYVRKYICKFLRQRVIHQVIYHL